MRRPAAVSHTEKVFSFTLAEDRTLRTPRQSSRAVPTTTKSLPGVGPRLLRNVRDVAAAHHLTISQFAAEFLERGFRERAETAGVGVFGPTLEPGRQAGSRLHERSIGPPHRPHGPRGHRRHRHYNPSARLPAPGPSTHP